MSAVIPSFADFKDPISRRTSRFESRSLNNQEVAAMEAAANPTEVVPARRHL